MLKVDYTFFKSIKNNLVHKKIICYTFVVTKLTNFELDKYISNYTIGKYF